MRFTARSLTPRRLAAVALVALTATLPACSVLGKKDGGSPPETMQVRNASGETVFYLYARPSGTSEWGSDLLSGDSYTMSDGKTGTVTLPRSRSCMYDFRGTNLRAEKQVVVPNVNVCRTPTVVVPAMR